MNQESPDPRLEEEIAKRRKVLAFQPIWIGLMLIVGIYIGSNLGDNNIFTPIPQTSENPGKLVNILNFIEENYVDSIDKKELIEVAINAMLEKLDPHSYYITAEEFASMQEPMEGNFEGIGVEFMIQRDTLMVVTPIPGGPSEMAGVRAGDRIIAVNNEDIAGKGLSNEKVMKLLKGPKGTEVSITVLRRNEENELAFNLVRDKIPIESVVASFVVKGNIGYLKLTRFAKTSYDEFAAAMENLRNAGARKLILDLRGNGGGYLNTAIPIAESFLSAGQLIVYTEGKASPRRNYFCEKDGKYRDMELVILINQGSASASEIVAGALQDHDRALTLGRRSFGKGLVQDEISLKDESALRLTVARYYTPTGRSIQKPYGEGIDYEEDYNERLLSGELHFADSVRFPDSLKFTTPAGKIVYGGGGIMPDVFIPLDSTMEITWITELAYTGSLRSFVFEYLDKNRSKFSYLNDFSAFLSDFQVDAAMLRDLVKFARDENVLVQNPETTELNDDMRVEIKAQFARQLFGEEAYYQVLLAKDPDAIRALEILDQE